MTAITINVNGLGPAHKVQHLLGYLSQGAGSPEVVFLQEVKCSDAQELKMHLQAGSGPLIVG